MTGVVAVALGALSPSLAACGPAGPAPTGVRILPDGPGQGQAWAWTAACPFHPRTTAGCRSSDPSLGSAQLSGDEWNLGGPPVRSGSVGMAVSSSGALTVQGDLVTAPPCTRSTCLAPSANTWVRGYPDVLYGIDQCHADTAAPPSGVLPLPVRVGAIPPDLIGTTAYSSGTGRVTYDIAYDMWLDNSGTTRPCQTAGTVEVMVWTDYDEKALLPPSLDVGVATVPFAVNGVARRGTSAWSIYASNIYQRDQTVPWGGTVWFVLNRADVVRTGTVSVDLSTVLAATGSLLETRYGWSDFRTTHWLDSVPFGIEFGPESATTTSSGPSTFRLDVSTYCLGVGTTVANPAC